MPNFPNCIVSEAGYSDNNSIAFSESWLLPKESGHFVNTIGDDLNKCHGMVLDASNRGAVCNVNSISSCQILSKFQPGAQSDSATATCKSILDAKDGKGVFAACKTLGGLLDNLYKSCQYDVCAFPQTKCTALEDFVLKCQEEIPCMFAEKYKKNLFLVVNIGDWRPNFQCESFRPSCPKNSNYSTCSSKCAPTCQKCRQVNGKKVCWGKPGQEQNCTFKTSKVCTGNTCRWQREKVCPPAPPPCVDNCVEGCVCDQGYVIDQTKGWKCVKIDECPDDSYLEVSFDSQK